MPLKFLQNAAWVAQPVKRPNLDLSSGLDLKVMSSSPTVGSMLGMEPTLKKESISLISNNEIERLVTETIIIFKKQII